MGRSPQRLDASEKVTGAAKYAGDIRLPGMLYARLLRPPAHGATLTRVDTVGGREFPASPSSSGTTSSPCFTPTPKRPRQRSRE